MPTEVIMPSMGESIVEGTITKWLKKRGDAVERDEPLFEISTDKVDAEIPSPASGVLTEIRAAEGSTVQMHTVVGTIQESGKQEGVEKQAPGNEARDPESTVGAATPSQAVDKAASLPQAQSRPAAATQAATKAGMPQMAESVPHSSPLVRKIARHNNIDLRQVSTTGTGNRVTKEDILEFLAKRGTAPQSPTAAANVAPPLAGKAPATGMPAPGAPTAEPPGDRLVPISKMRSIIAQRMVESKRTSAHVHTIFKIDMSRIVRIREREKKKYEQRNGVRLTYMPFLSRAVIATLRKMPIVNASLEGNSIRYHQHVHLGIAVALDWGLIVPVIKQAEERNFLGMARAIADVAERARAKKLKPDEVGSGTFTITNPGIFGEQFGTPVINQPETAILGVGGLFKEPLVVTDENGFDSIAIRSVIRLTLGFDHRVIDGADAGRFMAEVKTYLENWNEDIG